MLRRSLLVSLAAQLLLAVPAAAQFIGSRSVDRYEAMYGEPIDVGLDDLIRGDVSYTGRAVRTRGRLDVGGSGADRVYALRGGFGGSVLILPVQEVSFEFEDRALSWLGGEVEVTGVFEMSRQASSSLGQPSGYIQFWRFFGPEKEAKGPPKRAPAMNLEKLVLELGRHDGKTVRVVGKFRGRNLYGDLPARSGRRRKDWVIKHDLYAVWVTNKKPEGDGFKLDAKMKRDTGKWLAVVGEPETVGGVVYLRASHVSLAEPPKEKPRVVDKPPPPPRPQRPPVVVFSLPLDGDEAAQDGVFQVQFSNDMVIESFDHRVIFRYVGPILPGDRAFVGLSWSYDGGLRALTVDPGDLLRPGREVEMLMLPGIEDIEGQTLERRPGIELPDDEFVDVLRWYVEGS